MVIILSVISAIIWGGDFYRNNLQGIKPSLLPPPEDISELIESSNNGSSATADDDTSLVNKTSYPLSLPDNFSISIFAKDLSKPRVLLIDPKGTLLVSDTGANTIVGLPDNDGDRVSDGPQVILSDLNSPHGMAIRCLSSCKLYVAETDMLSVYDYDPANLLAVNRVEIMDLPSGGNHQTRTLIFMPSPNGSKLLISIGSSCNVCKEKDERRASVLVVDVDEDNDVRQFATGLRNAVFMTSHPVTNKIWVTENGRDRLGDDIPPDEINIISDGGEYGWPYCYGKSVVDADFDDTEKGRQVCSAALGSFIDIQAHSAPLGLSFIPEKGWPEEYQGNLLVAFHGSWNRTTPTGYKIYRYILDNQGNYIDEEDFISGWLTDDQRSLGRPVDILVQPDGIIYISDDKAGVIYRVQYSG